jgi:site-specific DNA-methyltransferase (adenine-specific)
MSHRIERGDGWELHAADWRDCDLPTVDAVIEDPPYGPRTHAGQRHARKTGTSGKLVSDVGLQYDHLEPEDVAAMMSAAHAVCPGWVLDMTSHDLIPAYEAAAESVGRYCFAPVPIVQPGMNVRLAGDGPSSWTVHLIVTRTTLKKCWGTKPGAYIVSRDYIAGKVADNAVAGGKPLGLMEAILRDYTDPGDLVLDRFTGGGTTGVACVRNGRRFVGYERKPEHFEIALARLRNTREQVSLFEGT